MSTDTTVSPGGSAHTAAGDCEAFSRAFGVYVAVRSGLVGETEDPEVMRLSREATAVMDQAPADVKADLDAFVAGLSPVVEALGALGDPGEVMSDPSSWDEAGRALEGLDDQSATGSGDRLERYVEQICDLPHL